MRDPCDEWERAVAVVGEDAARSIFRFSQQRAEAGPVREFLTRDFMQDACEEAADGLNYVTWGLQQLDAHASGDAAEGDFFAAYATALTHFVEGYNALARVHRDYLEWLQSRR